MSTLAAMNTVRMMERKVKQHLGDGDESPPANDQDAKSFGGQLASPLRPAVAGGAESREELRGCAVFGATDNAPCREVSPKQGGRLPRAKSAATTRVKMQCPQTKDFNYSRVSSKTRRRQQIDDLDEQLRQEQESSRRLRAAVSLLKRKLDAAEEGRRRSNGLERAFFSHLVEAEALVLQRDRLMAPGNTETRAECIEAARNEAHERLALAIRGELEENSAWRQRNIWFEPKANLPGGEKSRADNVLHTIAPPSATECVQTAATTQNHRSPDRGMGRRDENDQQRRPTPFGCDKDLSPRPCGEGNHHQRNTDETELAATDTWCWESDAIMQAYRVAAAGTVQKLASALFGRELLAVEAAKTSAAERERMVEERAKALFESQVSLQVERDQLQSYKASLRAEVREAKVQLEDARKQYQQQQDMVKDAERVHSSLSWRILTMQVARDKLAEAVGERLRVIQVAVRRRVGFLPWAVERAVNDLVGLCSTAGPTAGDGAGDGSYDDKALRLLGRGDGTSGSTSTSRSSSFRSSS